MKIPSILNGNQVKLKVPLKRYYMSDGTLTKADFAYSSLTDPAVRAISENNDVITVTAAGDGNYVLITISGTAATCGYYGLEITGTYSGRAVRSYVNRYFRLVHEEEEVDAVPDSNGFYVMEQPMVIR